MPPAAAYCFSMATAKPSPRETAQLTRDADGTWMLTYRVHFLARGSTEIRRPLDTKRLHVARLRRDALILHLGLRTR